MALVHQLSEKAKPGDVVLVTRDTNMRIKADSLGRWAEDYEHAHLQVDENYTGTTEQPVKSAQLSELYERGWLPMEPGQCLPNEFVFLQNEENPNQTGIARYDAKQSRLRLVGRHKEGVWGIFSRNKEQLFALDLLLDDKVEMVTLSGMAGTGKTLASAERICDSICLIRIRPVRNDIAGTLGRMQPRCQQYRGSLRAAMRRSAHRPRAHP